jgi:anti-anti-sigma factor
MEEPTPEPTPEPSASAGEAPEPEVTSVLDGDVARVSITGDLTEAARRPLVRVMTDLLLQHAPLRGVDLGLRDVAFMNSAGMAVLVQVQRMAAPRGIEVTLVDPPPAVSRPLQLSGLWRRFPIKEAGAGARRRAPGPAASPGGRSAGERPGGAGS